MKEIISWKREVFSVSRHNIQIGWDTMGCVYLPPKGIYDTERMCEREREELVYLHEGIFLNTLADMNSMNRSA